MCDKGENSEDVSAIDLDDPEIKNEFLMRDTNYGKNVDDGLGSKPVLTKLVLVNHSRDATISSEHGTRQSVRLAAKEAPKSLSSGQPVNSMAIHRES